MLLPIEQERATTTTIVIVGRSNTEKKTRINLQIQYKNEAKRLRAVTFDVTEWEEQIGSQFHVY